MTRCPGITGLLLGHKMHDVYNTTSEIPKHVMPFLQSRHHTFESELPHLRTRASVYVGSRCARCGHNITLQSNG